MAHIIDVFSDTARSIAAHHSFRAVRIEYPHAEISLIRGHDEHKTVAAYAFVSVTEDCRYLFRLIYSLLKAVHIDIVVAYPMHF